MIFIIAGDRNQALDWTHRHNLDPRSFFIVWSAGQLRGATINPEDVVRVGTYYKRKDLQRIENELKARDPRNH